MAIRRSCPNAAHSALARLEREWPGEVLVVTQNIDDLHERAGSRNLLHMHGELTKVRCGRCDAVIDWRADLGCGATSVRLAARSASCGRTSSGSARCRSAWSEIYEALDRCALFMSIGTSGHVYPAAGFVSHVRMYTRAHTVELNLEPSSGASMFAETVYGPATEVVPVYVDALLRWPDARLKRLPGGLAAQPRAQRR